MSKRDVITFRKRGIRFGFLVSSTKQSLTVEETLDSRNPGDVHRIEKERVVAINGECVNGN